MKKNEVSVKGVMSAEGVSSALNDLIRSMNEGKICIEHNEDFVTLLPADQIDFEIKAAVKKGKQKVEIELSWREVLPEEEVGSSLKISSTEPELPPEPAEEEAIPAPAGEPQVQLESETKQAEEPKAETAKPAAKKPAAKKTGGAKAKPAASQ
jgi:amphi-Trp domain-containing protein